MGQYKENKSFFAMNYFGVMKRNNPRYCERLTKVQNKVCMHYELGGLHGESGMSLGD